MVRLDGPPGVETGTDKTRPAIRTIAGMRVIVGIPIVGVTFETYLVFPGHIPRSVTCCLVPSMTVGNIGIPRISALDHISGRERKK